jgi:cytidylate kinase
MNHNNVSGEEFVKKQLKKWESRQLEGVKREIALIPVITVSGQPGSKGSIVAEQVAKRLEFDLFNRDIMKEIAQSVKMSTTFIDSIEKERLSGIEDFLASIVRDKYLHPDTYLVHLIKVVNTIAKHGRAVITGRGANFILPADSILSVRVIAPIEVRIKNVASLFGTSQDQAKRRVVRRESRRRAFIRQAYNADIDDPLNYDITVNTAKISIESAVDTVIGAIIGQQEG